MAAAFSLGDKVRIVKGTILSATRHDLEGRVGEVTAIVRDGTTLERITVAYDGTIEFTGIYAGMFFKASDPCVFR